MMNKPHLSHLSNLLVATLLISTSGALGRYIELPPAELVWWRSIIALIVLFGYCKLKRVSLKIKRRKDSYSFLLGGLLMGAHWITYFYALRLSNVAIGLLSLFTFPIITALLEPFFSKTKRDNIHLLLGAVVILGIYFLAPEFSIENTYFKGLLLGLVSAVFYALRTLLLKQQVANYNGSMLMLFQMLILSVVLVPTLIDIEVRQIQTAYPYVIFLGLVTTVIGHTLFINSLKHFKASTASIIASVQPIFGIAIAYVFLNEIPNENTYIGGALIILTVVIESIRSNKK